MLETELIPEALDENEMGIFAACEAQWSADDLLRPDDDEPDLTALFAGIRAALGRPQPADAGLDDALGEVAATIATGNQSLGAVTRQILHFEEVTAGALASHLQLDLHSEALMRLSMSVGQLLGAIGTTRLQSANLDALRNRMTGLLGKDAFYSDINRACETAHESGGRDQVSVVAIDLDGLKAINDAQGHPAGDAVIRALAGALSDAAGSHATPYHLSGDEFGLIVQGGEDGVREILEAVEANGAPIFSAGSVVIDTEIAERGAEGIYCEADIRMMEVKRQKHAPPLG
jgi:diguanylate cyclase (GGDEF)-like protein